MVQIFKKINSFIGKYYWLLIGLLFLILRLPTLFEPYWYGDEGIYLAIGQALRKGLLLYSQIHDNKPPTLYLLAALAHTVAGFRLMLLLFMIPTLYFFYRLANHFLNQKISKISLLFFLILTSIPLLEGTIANAEVFMLLPTIAAVLIFLDASSLRSYFLSGLFLGIAFTIKVPVFVEAAFLAFWLVITNFNFKKITTTFQKIALLGFGFLAPILVYAFYFYAQGNVYDFVFAALLQNFGYLASWSTGTHQSSFLQGGLFIRAIFLGLTWLGLTYLYFKKYFKDKYLFLLFWFSATIFASLLSGRPYPHYLIQVLPPLCLLVALLFYPRIHTTKMMITSALIIFAALLFKYNFYYYPVISYYSNYYSYLFHQKSYTNYASFFGDRVLQNEQIAQYIKANSSSSDKIFVWGDEPYIYPLSDRIPSGRFLVAYHIVDFNRYQETMEKIKAFLPTYIVVYPMSHRPFKDLFSFITTYYYPDQVFGDNIVVYHLR